MAQIISVGSGKGGVGKSVIASNLALLLARKGKRVILADLDVGGANVHVMFGHFNSRLTLQDFLDRRVSSLNDTALKLDLPYDLKIIVGTGETLRSANLHYAKKVRLVHEFRRMDADVVFIDVGPGTGYHSLDFFLLGDLQLAVTTPDPTSIVDVYRFIKLSAIRKALSPFLQRDLVAKNVAAQEFASIDHVLRAIEQIDQDGRVLVERAIADFKPCLILNRMSENLNYNTQILRSLLKEYIGKDLNVIGSIPDDEAVERSIRNFRPVIMDAPDSRAAASLERAARSLQLLIQMLPG